MRALRFRAKEDVRVEDVDEPTPGPGEVKLRNGYSSICGSDLHIYYEPEQAGVSLTEPHPVTGALPPQILGSSLARSSSPSSSILTNASWARSSASSLLPVIRRASGKPTRWVSKNSSNESGAMTGSFPSVLVARTNTGSSTLDSTPPDDGACSVLGRLRVEAGVPHTV
jgi:hypothetical protein